MVEIDRDDPPRRVVPTGRILVWAALLGLGLCVVSVLVGTALVLWPRTDHPRHADAIVVPSGDHGERLAKAMSLLRAGVAPTLVMVGQPDSAQDQALCLGGQPFEVVCLRPQPDSTRAEARSTARLASSRHWRTVVVATSTPHVTRARLLFSRCFAGRTETVGAKPPLKRRDAARARAHEVLGLLYSRIWARTC